ncbi:MULTISPECIES: DUF4188 domain-containing protein [Bacillus]|uniref:DUF4188 domain-containing protein n=1 Tax=Bacillus TaxID=1386 RepID=UPI0006174E5E|nr:MULTISPECIES: DUF4188 domain-containing protein [Bacillus]KKB73675.1 transcriptional regulator [Bacillus sp. TH008]MBU8785933.1 DUF4188 domain-containing protein [Bacillus glycinifermentans]MDU0072350.1 DUF4188 domain-containing protein [Bacillus sp. IG6]MED8020143.1 DUF4188 domain-containing protein [Bacillus glycinifermentans]NUJ15531.1 DUF4188 domain-containing protein [Bacillus glycinifermentans]
MGKTIFTKPMTADPDDEVVVFVIGMRINKWHAVHKWWPVFTAMSPMIRELYKNKDSGFLSMETSINFRTIFLIQYWRSFEALTIYAKEEKHMTAWRNYYQKSAASGAVGIYHETYTVPKGRYETFYHNMPLFGLAKAYGHTPVTRRTKTAEQRIRG